MAGSSLKRGKHGVGSELRWHHPQTLVGWLLWQWCVFTTVDVRRDLISSVTRGILGVPLGFHS